MRKLRIAGVIAGLIMLPFGSVLAGAKEDMDHADKLYAAGDFEGSVRAYGRAIDSGELTGAALASAYYQRGITYDRIQKNNEALSDYEFAVMLDPTHVSAWSSICYQKSKRENQLDDALGACNESLRLDPGHGPSYAIRGDIWRAKEKFAEGEKDYNHAVRLNPGSWLLLFNRGSFYDHFGKPEKARNDLIKAYRLAPQWGRTHPSTLRLFKKYGAAN